MDWIGWVTAGLLLIPFVMVSLEVLAAILPTRRRTYSSTRQRLAVLVPAHNEESGLARTISGIVNQIVPGDRLIVIADNCTDRTAEVARSAGAEVIERHEPERRGKGFALDFGLKHLCANPPAVVVIIDADTMVQLNAIDALSRAVETTGCPIQGINLLDAPPNAGPGARISAFAFFLKNYIRPRGLDRLGLPCLLYGTGMAFPFDVLARSDLAHSDITEDMRLGLEMALAGRPPRFCMDATVKGELPSLNSAARSQRRRWEHGHLRTLLRHVPRLLWAGLTSGNPRQIALALHVGVPPVSLLFLIGAIAVCFLLVLQQWIPAMTLSIGLGVTILASFIAWACLGRDRLPTRDLLLLPVYILKKIPLYLGFIFRPQKDWVRTERQS